MFDVCDEGLREYIGLDLLFEANELDHGLVAHAASQSVFLEGQD